MIIRLIIPLLLLCQIAVAGQGMGPGPGAKTYSAGGGDYSDIVFWWRAESSTLGTGDYPTSGITPTVEFDDGSGYTTGAMQVGTYGLEILSWDSIEWPVTTINQSAFRIGFWIDFKSVVPEYDHIFIKATSSDYTLLIAVGTDELMFYGPWGGLETTTANIASNTWYYIELYMDDANDIARIYINGVMKAESTSIFSSFGVITGLHLGGAYGNVNMDLDNLAVSTSLTRDLYALRNLTASPR